MTRDAADAQTLNTVIDEITVELIASCERGGHRYDVASST